MRKLNIEEARQVNGGWDRCAICGQIVRGGWWTKYKHCLRHAWNCLPYVFQFLIDDVMEDIGNPGLSEENMEIFAVLITSIAVIYILRYFAQMLRGRLMMFMAKRIDLPLMLGYYDHVIDLPMDLFSTRKTGDLISRFHDANKVQEALSHVTLTLLIDTVMVAFCGVTLYRLSPAMFFVTLIILGIYGAV